MFLSTENLRKYYFTERRRTRLGLGLREVCVRRLVSHSAFSASSEIRRSPPLYVPMRKSLSAGSRISFFHFHIPSCAHILVRFAARRRFHYHHHTTLVPPFAFNPSLASNYAALWYAHHCTLPKSGRKMCKFFVKLFCENNFMKNS